MKRSLLFALVLLSSFLAQAQFVYLKGVLSGGNEETPNASPATGVVIVKFNTLNNQLELFGHYRDLSATISGSHIHEAPVGASGPVRVTLTNSGGTTGWLSSLTTLTDAQETELIAGNMYVNVHSTAFPGGEIRSQLSFTMGETEYLTARLQGSQEVPPRPSAANGQAVALLDKASNTLFLTGSYQYLTNTISGSHVHAGLPGTNGGVIITLVNSGSNSGILEAVATVTDAQETQIATGGTYVNVHSTTFPGGEIRGQLTNYSQQTFFANVLSGANETTPNASTAKGTVIVRYDPFTNMLELTGDYQGLSGAISGSHLHGPAAPGADAGVLYTVNNTGGTSGTLSLSTTITEAQEADLYSGLLYVNVHSTAFPGGEIRTQLFNTSVGQSYYFTGFLQGSQEVPASGSAGTGTVSSLLDAVTGNIFITGSFSGLGSNATAAHLHQQRPGQNGGVILPLSISLSTSGTVTGSGTLTAAQADAVKNGAGYVNIHSDLIPSGELRAQLGNLVLPVRLVSFTGFKEQQKVTLTWTAAQESNILSYEIEQQDAETKAWLKKGTVAAKGGLGSINYRFSDVPSLGRSASVLYRIRMNGADGKVEYSNIIRINFQTGRGELTLLSNPVRNGSLRFVITGFSNTQKADATVVDQNGRIVARSQVSPMMNNEISIGHLASGMYRLVIRVNNEIMQESFIK